MPTQTPPRHIQIGIGPGQKTIRRVGPLETAADILLAGQPGHGSGAGGGAEVFPTASGLYIPAFDGNPEVGLLSDKGDLTTYPGGDAGNLPSGTYEEYIFPTGIVTQAGVNITVRDCWIYGGTWGVLLNGTMLMEDCEVGDSSTTSAVGLTQVTSTTTVTAKRVNIHHVEDGYRYTGQNNLFQQMWVHDLAGPPGAHHDASQDTGTSANCRVEWSHLDCWRADGIPEDLTGAVFYKPDLGNILNPTCHNNFLDGGAFTFWLRNAAFSLTGAVVTNNIFGLKGVFGFISVDAGTWVTWTGNKDINDNPVGPP